MQFFWKVGRKKFLTSSNISSYQLIYLFFLIFAFLGRRTAQLTRRNMMLHIQKIAARAVSHSSFASSTKADRDAFWARYDELNRPQEKSRVNFRQVDELLFAVRA